MTTTRRFIAYPHGNKAELMARVRAHRESDELVRGIGWDEGAAGVRGCAVGCTIHCYDHSRYPELLGVPVQIAHLEDWLFEHLPDGHLDWPERFLDAIQPGADLSGVYSAWVCRMLTRRLESLGDGQEGWRQQVRDAVGRVRDLWAAGWPGGSAASASASAARSAAESAAESAERSAARSAESAAWSAARSAAESARSAAESARSAAWSAARSAWSAAWSAESARSAESAEISRMADDLIELLAAAPIVSEA